MIELVPFIGPHIDRLHEIVLQAEAWAGYISLEQFYYKLRGRDSLTLLEGEEPIGAITYSDFTPAADVTMHVFVTPEYQKRWLSRRILAQVFGKVFEEYDLPRCSTYSFPGVTDDVFNFQLALGFKPEGVKRKAAWLADGLHDIQLMGMLREECRWIGR